MLIDTLTRFFSFAIDFQPDDQIIYKTTHTSSYTYWFLNLSAKILTNCSLSEEMEARHTYILHMIAVRLGKGKAYDYLFHTASIYASIISNSPVMCKSPFWGDFLRAVDHHHRDYLGTDLNYQQSRLCKALKADEVAWGNIDRVLTALGPSDAVLVSDQNPTLRQGRESGGQTTDVGKSAY